MRAIRSSDPAIGDCTKGLTRHSQVRDSVLRRQFVPISHMPTAKRRKDGNLTISEQGQPVVDCPDSETAADRFDNLASLTPTRGFGTVR